MTDILPNLVGYRIAFPGIPLPPIEASLYEYVMAGNGIFIRGARREFQSLFCITPCTIRGLADLEPSLELNAPHVPQEMVEEILHHACQARDQQGQPCEIVFHLELDEAMRWQCHVPSQRQSPMCARPSDDSPTSSYARACIEVHSHVDMHASFSSLDDQDEQGFRIYAVLGCISTKPVMRVRVGMYGYRHDIPAKWVFDLPPGIGDAVRAKAHCSAQQDRLDGFNVEIQRCNEDFPSRRKTMFSAGHLTSPLPADQQFSQYADAEKAAIAGSTDDDVWAVWEDESGEVRAVIYQQIVYLP